MQRPLAGVATGRIRYRTIGSARMRIRPLHPSIDQAGALTPFHRCANAAGATTDIGNQTRGRTRVSASSGCEPFPLLARLNNRELLPIDPCAIR